MHAKCYFIFNFQVCRPILKMSLCWIQEQGYWCAVPGNNYSLFAIDVLRFSIESNCTYFGSLLVDQFWIRWFTNAAYIPLVILYYIWTFALLAHLLQSIQVPLYVATKMASIRKSSFMVPSADTYARAAVRHIGYEPRCTPYWPHSVMWFLISILPESLIDNFRLGMCIKIRKKGLAKDAKKKSLWCFK